MMYMNSWIPEVFNDLLNVTENIKRTNVKLPAMNVLESEDGYNIEMAVPGVKKENLDVTVNSDGNLVVKLDNSGQQKEEKVRYLRREFLPSAFERALILPDDIDKNGISARVENGVLTIELPKLDKEEMKRSRTIDIG